MSFAPAILEAIQQRDERHLRDILSRIPEKDRAAQVNDLGRKGIPMLAPAAAAGVGLTAALLEAGAAVNRRDLFGTTALHLAAAHGQASTVEKLIECGADLDPQNGDGRTPLMSAARYNRADAVEVLLEAGADTSLVDRQGRTAEELAIGESQQVLVAHRERIVLRAAADVSDQPSARRKM